MLSKYRMVCTMLYICGLRSTRSPSPCNTHSAYTQSALHYANWDLLYEGSNNVPENNTITPYAYAYSVVCFLVMMTHPAQQLYELVIDHHSMYRWSLFCFSLITPVQYIQTYAYLTTDHIEPHIVYMMYDTVDDENAKPFMTSSTSSSASKDTGEPMIRQIVPEFQSKLTGQRRRYVLSLKIMRVVVCVGMVIFSTSALCIHVAEEYTSRTPLALSVLITAGMVWGTVVQTICVLIFSTVLFNHSIDLLHTCERLVMCTEKGCSCVVMDYLVRHIALLRNSVGTSIHNLHSIFSSFSVLWATGLSICIHTVVVGEEDPSAHTSVFMYMGCYGLVQILYVSLIYHIHCIKQSIVDAIHTPQFVMANLTRSTTSVYDMYDVANETGSVNNDNTLALSDRCKARLMIENASTLDWVVVNHSLQQEWTHFYFMGLSLNDSSMIKRCAALVGLVVGGRYLFSV
jgi:hypothetical protein